MIDIVVVFFYQNISSCVLNDGFSNGPFDAQRDVRQGDLFSPYLYILVLKALALSTQENKSNQGMLVDLRKIKLELFLLRFNLRGEESIYEFLVAIANFVKYTGLTLILIKQKRSFSGTHFSL